jgi:molybdopterin-containing oxidoreductase family membrane subunit
MALCAAYGYFMFSEYLTEGYKMHETSRDLMELLMLGRLAPFFWLFVVGGLLVPIVLIALPQTSNVTGITVAALAVVLGMWLKRFLIVVPGLAEPLMPSELTIYWPSQVEIAITVGAAAAIPLMLMFFFRLFPILSIYEMEEAAEAEHHREDHGLAPPLGEAE